jgi:multidrug efflux system membrane fusion protein
MNIHSQRRPVVKKYHCSKVLLHESKQLLGYGLVLVALIGLSSCSKKGAATDLAQQARQAGVPVLVAPVVEKTVPIELKVIGTGEAYSVVSIKSMINGEITRVNFTEGQDVKKGDLLFAIDSRPYQAALHQAEANLARDLAQQKNALDQAVRNENLFKQGIIPQQTAEQLRATADSYDATLLADRAAIEAVKVQLSYCSIYSPIDGRTGSVLIHQGNVVKANDTTSLVVINQINPIYVSFSVAERYFSEIKQRMNTERLKVSATIPKNDGSPEEGVLTFIDNAVDSTTGTLRLKGTFPNRERHLWPGQFVNIILRLSSQPHTVVVPTQAIQTGQGGQFVYVVKADQTVESRQVVAGRALEGETVVEKGLQPGETVVTDGQLRLAPGSRVQIKNAASGAEVKGS